MLGKLAGLGGWMDGWMDRRGGEEIEGGDIEEEKEEEEEEEEGLGGEGLRGRRVCW